MVHSGIFCTVFYSVLFCFCSLACLNPRLFCSLAAAAAAASFHLCPTPCKPMDCNMTGFPVHHQLLELDKTHVHQVSDAIQPSQPLSSPSLLPSIFTTIRVFSKVSQFFATGGQSIGASVSASVLPINIQGSFPVG